MTVAVASSGLTTEVESFRREWVRPSIQLLAAGSAESADGPDTDGLTNPS